MEMFSYRLYQEVLLSGQTTLRSAGVEVMPRPLCHPHLPEPRSSRQCQTSFLLLLSSPPHPGEGPENITESGAEGPQILSVRSPCLLTSRERGPTLPPKRPTGLMVRTVRRPAGVSGLTSAVWTRRPGSRGHPGEAPSPSIPVPTGIMKSSPSATCPQISPRTVRTLPAHDWRPASAARLLPGPRAG